MNKSTTPSKRRDALQEQILTLFKERAGIGPMHSALGNGRLSVDTRTKEVIWHLIPFFQSRIQNDLDKRNLVEKCVQLALRDDFKLVLAADAGAHTPVWDTETRDEVEIWSGIISAVKQENPLLASFLGQGGLNLYSLHHLARLVVPTLAFEKVNRNPEVAEKLKRLVEEQLGEGYTMFIVPGTYERPAAYRGVLPVPQKRPPQTFEEAKQEGPDGTYVWDSRDLARIIGYDDFAKFLPVLAQAKSTYAMSSLDEDLAFYEVPGPPPAVLLNRRASYLTILASDPTLEGVKYGHLYFAEKAEEGHREESAMTAHRRIELRDRLAVNNKNLRKLIIKKGLKLEWEVPTFFSVGKRAFYQMDERTVKERKGIDEKDDLFDCIGPAELAAHDLRTELAAIRIGKAGAIKAQQAYAIHDEIGTAMRDLLIEQGVRPEDLPAHENIRLARKKARALEQQTQLPPAHIDTDCCEEV